MEVVYVDSTTSEGGSRLYEIVAPQCREQFACKLLEIMECRERKGASGDAA